MKKLTIVFDLDNTLCTPIRRNHPEDILKVKPKNYLVDILKNLKKRGHEIIISIRRDAVKNGRNLTKQWLKKYNVPYDKLITNKLHYDLFVGDRQYSSYQTFITSQIIEGQTIFAKEHIRTHIYRPKRKIK